MQHEPKAPTSAESSLWFLLRSGLDGTVHRQTGRFMPINDKSDPKDAEKPDADEVFAATLRNLVNTPHQPHKPKVEPVRRGQKKAR